MDWNWIRESFEGPDGKASHKKLTVFVLVTLYTTVILYAILASILDLNELPTHIFYSLESMALAFSGLNTVQSIKQKPNQTTE